jgi:leucyl aminopeptidase
MTLETTRRLLQELLLPAGAKALPIRLIASADDPALEALNEAERDWVEAQDWSGKQGSVLLLPDGEGGIGGALLGTGGKDWTGQVPLLTGVLPNALPEGDYRFASPLPDPDLAALGFLAGSYRFARYKSVDASKHRGVVLPDGASQTGFWRSPRRSISAVTSSTRRPTISVPPSFETAARELANTFDASIKVTEGSGLLSDNFHDSRGRSRERPHAPPHRPALGAQMRPR